MIPQPRTNAPGEPRPPHPPVQVDPAVLRGNRLIAGLEPCPYVDAFKVLRTRVSRKMREQGWTTLAVTSPDAGAGKTLVAINLALGLALEYTQQALLVDANLRDPGIHRRLGLEPQNGLADHLLDHVPLEQITLRLEGIDRLALLPGGRPLVDSAELLSSPGTADMVQELKRRHPDHLMVFDLPHLGTSDTLAFAPLVDAVLLVVGAGKTRRGELAQAVEHLRGIPILGTVLNDAETFNA